MSNYVSEELNNGFFQDNNNYEEIGELHANSKNTVVGRIDSRYDATKKKSLLYPDSDRLIYDYYSDAKVCDMAIRPVQDSLNEKMLFIGNNFITIYDSDGGNFILKEPKDLLSSLKNPHTMAINPGFAGLDGTETDPDEIERLTDEEISEICSNLLYCTHLGKYFLIFVDYYGHVVPFKLDPDNFNISKFAPKLFYDELTNNNKLLFKPIILNDILYLFVSGVNNRIELWTINVNDPNPIFTKDITSCASLGKATVGEDNSFGITVEEINNQPVIKAFNAEFTSGQNSLKAIALTIDDKTYTCKNYTVVEKSNFSYSYSGIKEIKTVAASEKIHILVLLKNGTLKIVDDGYINNTLNVYTRKNIDSISYFIHNKNNEMNNKNVLRFYNGSGKINICCKASDDNSENTLNGLFTDTLYAFDNSAWTKSDNLGTNFNYTANIINYHIHNGVTIIFGYHKLNGIIKPLIKCINPDKNAYIIETTTLTDKEYDRPFDNSLEPNSGIDIVKNVEFGKSKLVKVEIKPDISDTVPENAEISISGKDFYSTGEILWTSLYKSGIPFNTQVKTFGRIIIDGHDIPIESVLFTRPDTNKTYGSVLLTFDKMFDINSLEKKYIKLGNVLYPGILFRNNEGFLNDAMISNVFNVDNTFAYDDANNGKMFEDELSLTIKQSIVLNEDNENPIMVVAASGGKIASVDINTGSFTTPNGTDYGKDAPGISSVNIPYNQNDGEIVTMVRGTQQLKNYIIILFTSGKIIKLNILDNSISIPESPYVSSMNCKDLTTVYNIKNDTLTYVVNDNTRNIARYDISGGSEGRSELFSNLNPISNIISIDNNFYFVSSNKKLIRVNLTSAKVYACQDLSGFITREINGPCVSICYDFNDRIYIAVHGNDGILRYYSLSENTVSRYISSVQRIEFVLGWFNDSLYTIDDIFGDLGSIDRIYHTDNDFDNASSERYIGVKDVNMNFNRYSSINHNYIDDRLIVSFQRTAERKILKIEISKNHIDTSEMQIHSDGFTVTVYDTSKNFIYLTESGVEIANYDDDIVNPEAEGILGYANNVFYFVRNDKLYARDLRKTHYNINNEIKTSESVINLVTRLPQKYITDDLPLITAIGYADKGNLLAIAFKDGSVDSIYLPEFNAGNGYYESNMGDTIENYSRTIYVERTITSDTLLKNVDKPSMNGYSFIGWSYDHSEANLIPVEYKEALNSTNIPAGTTIYGVMKDNIEEYTDRCATRLYAKAGEISDTPIVSIEELGDDVYFKTTSKSIRWASDIGVFFNGHDEDFTEQNTSRDKGEFNFKLKSGIYINGAGSVNVGKYIFYINGYNPSAINPQTTVHNGIVVYDSQYNEYAVLSKGTDNLHGSILSRIYPYCHYHNGYIYIFGGLTRRDIHGNGYANGSSAIDDNNNLSKFSRTNKIERYDIRSGEYCILEAKYGPDDRFEYGGTNEQQLIFCGLDEIRHLSETNDDGNYLTGSIYISELGYEDTFIFNLDDEAVEENPPADEEEVDYSNMYYLLTRIKNKSGDKEIQLIRNKKLGDGVNLTEEYLFINSGNDSIRYTLLSNKDPRREIFVNISEFINEDTFILQILNKTDKELTTRKIKINDSNEFEILEESISTGNNILYDSMYFDSVIYCKNKVSKVFSIGNNEYLIDNTYKAIKSKDSTYIYTYDKAILHNVNNRIEKIENDIPLKAVSNDNDKVVFAENNQFIIHFTSTKLTIKKINNDGNELTISKNIKQIDSVSAVYQHKDNIITVLAFNNENTLFKVISYFIDKHVLIERSVNEDTYEYMKRDYLYYSEKYNSIYSYKSNHFIRIYGIDAESIDDNKEVKFVKKDFDQLIFGYDVLSNNTINIYIYSEDETYVEIRTYELGETGDVENEISRRELQAFDIRAGESIDNKIINNTIVSINNTVVRYYRDNTNYDEVHIPSEAIIYQIDESSVRYLLGNERFILHRLYKQNQNDNIIHVNDTQLSGLINAYICDNDEYVFVYNSSSITQINKKTNDVKRYHYKNHFGNIVGIFSSNDNLYLVDSSLAKIHIFNLHNWDYSYISNDRIEEGSNIKSSTSDNRIFVLIDANVYELVNNTLSYITSNIPIDNILDMRYIKEYDSLYFVSCPASVSNIKISSYNLINNTLKEISVASINNAGNKPTGLANVGNDLYLPTINLDKYGNLMVIGGDLNEITYNPTQVTIYDGSNYKDFIKITGKNTDNRILRSIIDNNYYYTLAVDSFNQVNYVKSVRPENEYRGSLNDIETGTSLSVNKQFTFNNELFKLSDDGYILVFNKKTKRFESFSNSNIPFRGNFVSANSYPDGTVYFVFVTYELKSIIFNLIGYNLNTKKVISNVTESVYNTVSNITRLSVPLNSSWRGKYFITLVNTLQNSVLVVLNVFKLENIAVMTRPINGTTDGTIAYFKDRIFEFGAGKYFGYAKLTGTDNEITQTDILDAVGIGTSAVVSGNRLLLRGSRPSEISLFNKDIMNSDTRFVTESSSHSIILPVNDNKVAAIIPNNYDEDNLNSRASVYEFKKSPIVFKEIKENVAIKIYSGVTQDIVVIYDITNNETFDKIVLDHAYGSSISKMVKYDDDSYLLVHSDTPRISTLVVNDKNKLSIKRYDGTMFGEVINTGTNLHTVQDVDLTMIFDSEIDNESRPDAGSLLNSVINNM